MTQCCGRQISQTGERFIKWAWLALAIVMLIVCTILFAIGFIGTNKNAQAFTLASCFVFIATIINFAIWICYHCNSCGIKDEGCCLGTRYDQYEVV